jgi:hypothetical protein
VPDFGSFAALRTLHSWHAEIRAFAAERLRLHLHEHKCQVYPTKAGVPFLGFRHFADHRRLKREGVVRFRRRLRIMQRDYAAGQVSRDKIGERIQSWCAHAAHGNTYRLRNQLLRHATFTTPATL